MNELKGFPFLKTIAVCLAIFFQLSKNITVAGSNDEKEFPAATLFVNNNIGNDNNKGTSKDQPFATIQKAVNTAAGGDIIEVSDGIYYETISVSNKKTNATEQIWLRAANCGKTILSGAIKNVRESIRKWVNEGNNIWSIKHSEGVWGAYHLNDNVFLLRFKTLNDLEAGIIQLQDPGKSIKSPTYGIAHEGGKLYIRLKDGSDPNGQNIIIPKKWHVELLKIKNTPYFHLDGFWIEAGGDQGKDEGAVTFDSLSEHGSIMNCISTLQRTFAYIPGNFVIRWSEHSIPGFKELAEDFRMANQAPPTANHIWDYIKNYNRNPGTGTGGNAYYGGSLCASSSLEPSENIIIEHNYIHDVFDGLWLGQFENSSARGNVFDYIYDDCIELETAHDMSNVGAQLKVYENLFLNSSIVWLSRRTPKEGPIFVYRNLLKPYDLPHGRGMHLIKTGGDADMFVYFNTLIKLNGMDHCTTWLEWVDMDMITWENDVDEIRFRNNAIIFEDGLTGNQPDLHPDTDYNLFYSRFDHLGVRGENGVFINKKDGFDAIGFSEYGIDWTPVGRNLVSKAGPIPSNWAAPDNGWSQNDIGCFQVENPYHHNWIRSYNRSYPFSVSTKFFENPRTVPHNWDY